MASLNACKKDSDPEPVSPVVGRWELNRGQLSGFVAPNTGLNTLGIDLYNYDFGSYASRIDIRTDKSFINNIRQDGQVADVKGTWDYASTTLTLKYTDGDSETFTYTLTDGVEELAAPNQAITFPVSATATAPGQLQIVYRK
ncbi:hypothetical protein GCM10027423_24880 [Spirosoma arcticum]